MEAVAVVFEQSLESMRVRCDGEAWLWEGGDAAGSFVRERWREVLLVAVTIVGGRLMLCFFLLLLQRVVGDVGVLLLRGRRRGIRCAISVVDRVAWEGGRFRCVVRAESRDRWVHYAGRGRYEADVDGAQRTSGLGFGLSSGLRDCARDGALAFFVGGGDASASGLVVPRGGGFADPVLVLGLLLLELAPVRLGKLLERLLTFALSIFHHLERLGVVVVHLLAISELPCLSLKRLKTGARLAPVLLKLLPVAGFHSSQPPGAT